MTPFFEDDTLLAESRWCVVCALNLLGELNAAGNQGEAQV